MSVTPEQHFEHTADMQVCFTDGSAKPNKKVPAARGGFGIVFCMGPATGRVALGSIKVEPFYATNQRGEGVAILRCMQFMAHAKMLPRWKKLHIVTDSCHWIKMIDVWMPAWEKKGMDFDEKTNSDLTKALWRLVKALRRRGKTITLEHVYAHDKKKWSKKPKDSFEYFMYQMNDLADHLATEGRVNMKPGETTRRAEAKASTTTSA